MARVNAENVLRVEVAPDAKDEEVWTACRGQEAAIEARGGLGLVLLGVSSSGRLAFHEPDFAPPEGAQVAFVELDKSTRISAASDFFGVESVPTHGITVSCVLLIMVMIAHCSLRVPSTALDAVLSAKEVAILAFGEGKAGIVKKTVEGSAGLFNPASLLQNHKNAHFYVDEAAAAGLTR